MNLLMKNDHIVEIILSLFRWVFLLIAGSYYYIYLDANNLGFTILFLFGIVYMTISEFALRKTPINSKIYLFMTKVSVVLDYIAFLGLVSLTGGADSPFFPTGYLIILHAAVYWKFSGGIVASFLLGAGYTVILLFNGYSFQGGQLISYLFDWMFLVFIGVLGGIIVTRERTMRSKNTKLEDIARQDFLTDLYNHRAFQEDLHICSEDNHSLMLVLSDIDYFKSVNDRFGHLVGDDVLKKIGTVVKEELKDDGRAYRYGGEEIAFIMDATNSEEAKACLLRIQSVIRKLRFTAHAEHFSVTMSYGTAIFPPEGSIDECLRMADERLYEAKRLGRNRICWFDDQVEEGHAR
ncbi:GGDEF domain-containing protein [Guptibacillus hwajinpoensis]|uniref:Diguanylate cyclase (GGDEF)-like protein n=1 Tax=Guptibacillus hwajinpoensis TaxID=208199 RepID=A0ABU0JYN1_9BACL|nr:diguanylate cyclase [Alkalihalobacillus hemicentroti]MDQ0482173.1 diguanylate cyclase (GGDEF)-like protein [Alkalihalobacillus hemicentroti]